LALGGHTLDTMGSEPTCRSVYNLPKVNSHSTTYLKLFGENEVRKNESIDSHKKRIREGRNNNERFGEK